MASAPTQATIDALATAVRDVDASRFFTYATFCLLIYDHLLTIGEEIHLVWQSRSVNLVKVLFVLNRYMVPLILAVDVALISGTLPGLTKETCHAWFLFDIIMEVLSLFSTTYIITLRIRALWTDNREINILLHSTWILNVLATTGLLINSTIQNISSYTLQPELNICFAHITDSWLIWLPAMVFHFVMFVLLGLKAISTPRNEHTKLMSILLVDGFVFFAVVFGAMFTNLLLWALANPDLAQLPHDSVWAISTLAITRLLLSLQRRYHGDGEEPEIIAGLAVGGLGIIPPLTQQSMVKLPITTVDDDNMVKLRAMTSRAPNRGNHAHTRSRSFAGGLARARGGGSSLEIVPPLPNRALSRTPGPVPAMASVPATMLSKVRRAASLLKYHVLGGPKPSSNDLLTHLDDAKTESYYSVGVSPYFAHLDAAGRPSTMFEMSNMQNMREEGEPEPAPSYHSHTTRSQSAFGFTSSSHLNSYGPGGKGNVTVNFNQGELSPPIRGAPDPYASAATMAGIAVPSARMHEGPRAVHDPFYAYYQQTQAQASSSESSHHTGAGTAPTTSNQSHDLLALFPSSYEARQPRIVALDSPSGGTKRKPLPPVPR